MGGLIYPTLISRFRNNLCKDDSSLLSRFLHGKLFLGQVATPTFITDCDDFPYLKNGILLLDISAYSNWNISVQKVFILD